MSYRTVGQNIDIGRSQENYTTSIENLPELDDLETQQYSGPVQTNNSVNIGKFINCAKNIEYSQNKSKFNEI